ncbi:MAG: hypothetical protein OM95_12300 [Bdellovibrio sp. ArHS]|uniref:hypothetical protein n=1 Tax=Bdellovibrio sp. ArHS TaxID=1569284 RepID=UPI0005829523|nr:hypothetical protein [Bdellovibrio sp. ArHS]KHD87788.1 MAG: hypothetical protein OM95_12300 [Bdellovibrio sp. ArHS]
MSNFLSKLLFWVLFLATGLSNLPAGHAAPPLCQNLFSETLSSPAVPLISMDSRYRGEDRGLYIDPVTQKPWQVHYYSMAEKNAFELIPQNGLLVHRNGKKADSPFDAESLSFESALLVIDKDLRIFILPFEERGRFHHSSLSAGEDVLFAGTAAFNAGVLRELSDQSGHYKPSPQQTLIAIKELQKMGVDLSMLKLSGRIAQHFRNTYYLSPKEVRDILNAN